MNKKYVGGGATLDKKAFTLIELLAVIVILAVIALIATPIIIGIINDAENRSNERSIEQYADAIRNAVAAERVKGIKITNINQISDEDMKKYYDGDVTCDITEIHEDGTLYLAGCSINGVDVDYTYGEETICKAVTTATVGTVPQGRYVNGDEYVCDVKGDGTYDKHFFVVKNDTANEQVKLIFDHNVDLQTGEGATSGNTLVWNSSGSNTNGMGTGTNELGGALETLQTKWTNVNVGLISAEEAAAIVNAVPDDYPTLPAWMYVNLNDDNPPYAYWTSSAHSSDAYGAWDVRYDGYVSNRNVDYVGCFGLRPVITVLKSKLN